NTIQESQLITVDPAPAPIFINVPQDTTLSCTDAAALTATNLGYSNGESGACSISGTVPGSISGSFDVCGGILTQTWTYTDTCGNTITATQTLTVEPVPAAQFTESPSDSLIQCTDVVGFTFPDLPYSNGASGACSISGVVSPVVDSNLDQCGGTVTATWTFTDSCGRTITEAQTLTVEPAPPAQFINAPPTDTTLSCADIQNYTPPDLQYSNNASGACQIDGAATPQIISDYTICGGNVLVTWEFTDSCGRMISHVQTIQVEASPPPTFVGLPADTTVTCAAADTMIFDDLTYTNGLTGACEVVGSVTPSLQFDYTDCGGTITATWDYADTCGNVFSGMQVVTVLPADDPVFINPPADVTLTCEEIDTMTFGLLDYSNSA
ncbi:MAG: hypothetical protein R3330_17595, partial [Saprospiraceae bacterium]|nr:hypothetical protein [Saprospiraceae bacterium]